MKWKSFRAQLLDFSLTWDLVGLPLKGADAFCRSYRPNLFNVTSPLGSNVEEGHYWEWKHRIEGSGWPGNYATIWMRHDPKNNKLHVSLTATPDNNAYPEGMQLLRNCLKNTQAGIENIELWLSGDGYAATVLKKLSIEQLDLLLSDVVIDMEESLDHQWPHATIYLSLEKNGEEMILRRL